MENLWIKLTLVIIIAFFLYREILKSLNTSANIPKTRTKAGFFPFLGVGTVVAGLVYLGISITRIETRDLRPIIQSSELVSIYDEGIIQLNGMYIKTNLAKPGELRNLANDLTKSCNGNDGCEVQKLFDYVTHIPYKTDYTSRHPFEVIKTNWGDCDDKSNLFASLLNEKGYDYRFVYVTHHVFVVVHLNDTQELNLLNAKLTIDDKDFYYAETTATGAKVGEFNGQFPYSFEGVYDLKNDSEVPKKTISFGFG